MDGLPVILKQRLSGLIIQWSCGIFGVAQVVLEKVKLSSVGFSEDT